MGINLTKGQVVKQIAFTDLVIRVDGVGCVAVLLSAAPSATAVLVIGQKGQGPFLDLVSHTAEHG